MRIVCAIGLMALCLHGANAASSFDPTPWREDLAQAREAVSTKYANLEWLVLEREVDLPALFADAEASINSASSAVDAQAAFDRLARRFADGHVRFRWPQAQATSQTPTANCSSLGYDARMRGASFATHIPGYAALSASSASAFPAGSIQLGYHKVGVIQIGLFSPQGYPQLCAAAIADLHITPDAPCDDACSHRIESWASDRMSHDLENQLHAIKAAGADILLVDITNNGGGTDWAEAAARMLTSSKLKSARIGFVRGAHWTRRFGEMEADLRSALKTAPRSDRALLKNLADAVAARSKEAATPCDSSPLWRGARPSCQWLGEGFFASGLLPTGDMQRFRGKSWSSLVFVPAQYPLHEGAWQGPLLVLVNAGTGSAAELFAAVLQDNQAAVVIGSPTAGAGCGHTDGGTPTTLKNSGGILELPDCARLRADGSNEVMGIQPDVLVGLRWTDGPHRQAQRVAAKLPEAANRAVEQQPDNSEWQPLFNGKSLEGWRLINGTASYEVVDGAIVGTTRPGTPNSFLATEKSYDDFILEFEVRQSVGPTNSGVQFRSQSKPDVMQGRVHGPQMELDPSERQWTGGLYDEAMRGWWYPGTLNPHPGLYKFDEWNQVRIEAIGPSMRTWVNGVLTAYVIDPNYKQGFIALQVHSIEKPEDAGRKIHWRNLRIKERAKPSPPEAEIFVRNTLPNDLSDVERKQGWRLLWDGKSPTGWRSAKGGGFPVQGWRIENGEWIVAGNTGGDIVTEESFGAFELQLEFKLTAGANSGIKYYVGDGNTGALEYQLLDDEKHPDAKLGVDGNRTLASLYDIKPRNVLLTSLGIKPKIDQWQHARIVSRADGTVEHWLNGVKVLEFTRGSEDFRQRVAASKFKAIPKFGEAQRGRLLLQDHGDEVHFRSVKVRPL